MALREGTRRWLQRIAWAGFLVSLSLWLGLCLGRPLYYTDGSRQFRADALADDGMLRWASPEVVAELPGPVTGRVARLGDGRLIYGRIGSDGTSDLVVFDPQRPALPPEPAYGLNTEHNELAPAVGPDGALWFASDRPGGVGGYDLYASRSDGAHAAPPVPVALVNTARDETDPAPSPDGSTLVFVRIDRAGRGPDDGRLFAFTLAGDREAVPLFGARHHGQPFADRDPAFTADGGELWFVRRQAGQPLALLRASVHQGRWDEPRAAGADWGIAGLRAPLPSPDGARLHLLQQAQAGGADLWYAAAAREVHPYRQAQRWLEWLLLGFALTCALLLLLLHLGRRWATIDLLVQCLLLSLLLHVLLFLWLMGLEITGSMLPGDEAGSGLEVSIVFPEVASDAGAAGGPVQQDVAAMAAFAPSDAAIEAAAPGAAVVRAGALLAGPQADLPAEPAAAADAGPAAALQDAASIEPPRSGRAEEAAVAAAALPAVAAVARAAAAAEHTPTASEDKVLVHAPTTAMAGPSAAGGGGLAPPTAPRTLPAPRAVAAAEPEFADAAPAAPLAAAPAAEAAAPAVAAAFAAPAELRLDAPATSAAVPAPPREPASGGAPAAALVVPVPDAALGAVPRTGHRGPVAALPAAPRRSTAAERPIAGPQLRDPAVLPPTAAAASPASAAAPALGAAALVPVSAAAPAGVAAPAPRSAADMPRLPAAAAGSLLLPAPAGTVAAPPPAVSRPLPSAPGRAPSPGAVALREPNSAPTAPHAAPVATNPVAGAARTAPAAVALPAPATPRAAAAHEPERAAAAALGLAAAPPPRPPGSLWQRTPLAPLAADALVRTATAYSNRFGPAKAAAIERFGGSADTERAVRDGLRYLARIQNRDGSWGDRRKFDGKYGLVYVGKTALCVLAFLGAGHTPVSDTEHSAVVRRALDHLLALQDEDTGAFGPSSCYGHGIATYAIAECYGLTKDAALRRPLENALQWLLLHQGPRADRRNRGGWGYFSPGLEPEDAYARVSVTAWMVMALESARLSGIELPEAVLPNAREYLEASFDAENGWFRYNHKPSRLQSEWPTLPASTPAGAFCLLLLGVPADDPRIAAAIDYTVERRPERYGRYRDDDFVLRGQGNVYFWYYGSLACFLAGGESWQRWNERLKTVLPAGQAEDGSFPPIDAYARYADDDERDRSYTTAMCVLSLEVYYRYFTPLLIGR